VADAFEAVGIKGDVYDCMRTHEQITAHKKGRFAEQVPFFHRELNDQTDDYDQNVAPVEEASERATHKRHEAMVAVFETVPTTLAGMRAKIDFAMSVDHVTESLTDTETFEPLCSFLNTLYESARLLTVQS
jgi:hypothetical protein